MATVIGALLFGILFAYFATQNQTSVSIRFVDYTYENIPLYFIVLGSVLLGVIIAWILSLSDTISSYFQLHGKDVKLKKTKETVAELTQRVNRLEVENEELKSKRNNKDTDDRSI